MQQLLDSPLAAAPAHLDRPAVIDAQRTWTWRQVHEASMALSRRLANATSVCNLCTSRLGFLITCLAALRNRCLLVLPPSGGNADLAAVLQAGARPVVVGDSETWPEPWSRPGTMPYLSCATEWKSAGASAEDLAWQPAWDEVAVMLYTSGS